MLFNDRDLAVLGIGSASSVLCLLLPFTLAGKFIAGGVVLVTGVGLTFARFGRDRLPFEEWLKRRMRFALRPRRWTFHVAPHTKIKPKNNRPADPLDKKSGLKEPVHLPRQERTPLSGIPANSHLAERAAGMLLAALGVYLLFALWSGDAADIALFIRRFFP